MKVFFRFFKQYPRESIAAPLFKLLEACFDLLVPLVIATMIDEGIGHGDRSLIFRMTIVLVGLAIVGLACAVAAQYFAAKAAVGGATKLRHDLFSHIQSFTYAQTDKVGTSTLMTRLTSDINQLQSGVNMTLRLMLRSPIIVFGAAILAFTVDKKLASIFIVTIPILAAIVFAIMLGGIPLYRKVQGRLDRVTGSTRENLNGVRVIRAFCKESEEIKHFNRINREQTAYQNKAGYLSSAMTPLTYIVINLATVILLDQGAVQVQFGDVTQGEMVALINYMSQILIELVKLANTTFLVTKAVACGKRVETVLDIPAGYAPSAAPAPATQSEPSVVSFDHVSMSYHKGGEPSLKDVHFSVSAGQTVGIIGGTGSGKSTLVNLIPRFYDVTEGSVTVMGRDVRSYDPVELRSLIGVVPQKAVLFKGTIRDNLKWGNPDASEIELWQALTAAQASDFVKEKDGQLDAPVAQRGKNFSGGQRQRLTIARALVGEKPILILDDSASALDFATEAHLRRALQQLPHHPTTFIVSQRTASVRFADLIIVLENGQVCGMGQHDDLLATCGVYREIYESQFKGGEDA